MLAKFQKEFLELMLENGPLEPFKDYLKESAKITKDQSLTVYKSDYRARLQEALGKSYEATWILLGDEDFSLLAQKYISTHHSSFRNLSAYGHLFSEFLAQEEIDPEIITMARFEQKFWQLFNQKGNPAQIIDNQQLANLHFDISGSINLYHTTFKLRELWEIREENNTELMFEQFEGEQFVALYKSGEKVSVKVLSEIQFIILNQLSEIKTLPVLFEYLEIAKINPSQEEWAGVFEVLSYCNRTLNIGKVKL